MGWRDKPARRTMIRGECGVRFGRGSLVHQRHPRGVLFLSSDQDGPGYRQYVVAIPWECTKEHHRVEVFSVSDPAWVAGHHLSEVRR